MESVTEKQMIKEELPGVLVLPLNQIRGVMFLSEKTLYFQNFLQGKRVKRIAVKAVVKIYKKRFEL